MTNTERSKIESIIKYCKEVNPAAVGPIVSSLLSIKISDLLEQKRNKIKKEI